MRRATVDYKPDFPLKALGPMASILLVEDDELVGRSIFMMLSRVGHNVTVAKDGLRGFEELQKGRFDTVVTDIMMPEQDGLWLIREIRKFNTTVGILAISGGAVNGKGDYLQMALGFGADATLAKPFLRRHLESAVSGVLAEAAKRSLN